MFQIVPIIEGHGEVEAVPALIYRIAHHLGIQVQVQYPIRVKASSFLQFDAEFRRHVQLAGMKARDASGMVLVILDCEDDCPAELGPRLRVEAEALVGEVPVLVVLAYREFETWFLHSLASLQKAGRLDRGVTAPTDPESIRDAKGWLSRHMTVKYRETEHQREFVKLLAIEDAMASDSFRRFVEKLEQVAATSGAD